jgi:hypothetical protein
MSLRSAAGHTPWGMIFLVVLLLAALAYVVIRERGMHAGGYVPPSGPTPTAAPASYFTSRIDSAPRSAVLSYARSLHYDAAHGAGDFRRVMLGSCPRCTYGPHVFLRPERGAAALDTIQLAEGRIVAQLVNLDADSYAKFNLAAHDTVYWWVDRKGPGNTYRSYYVSSDTARPLRLDTLIVHTRGTYPGAPNWGRTLARFVWRETDEALWVACDMAGCCTSSGTEIF